MLTLNTKIERLAGVGPSLKKTLNSLGLFYIEDLLYHLPFRYVDFSKKVAIGLAKVGEMVTIEAKVISVEARRSFKSRLQFTEAILEDNTGQIKVVWFNQPYIAKQLPIGSVIIIAGKIEWYKEKQITNPFFEKLELDADSAGKILPIYHLTKGLSNLRLAKLIKLAWQQTTTKLDDYLDKKTLSNFNLLTLSEAIATLHFPTNSAEINKARFRIAIDDCLPQQIASNIKQAQLKDQSAPVIQTDVEYIKKLVSNLPFKLTDSQKRATWDILQELSVGVPHNRLLEGDVGSGKTVVAWLIAMMAVKNGYQVAIMAPTEILAKQHHQSFISLCESLSTNAGLFTQNFHLINNEVVSKQDLIAKLSENSVDIVIGTHALLSEHLKFHNLGLIIIDEQHRFGVGQRAYLQKSHSKKLIPHLLSMSATPIPRSLGLALFGNLQISQLTQLPKNRQQIITKLLLEDERKIAYKKIEEEVSSGRQVFIITPKVEESSTEVKSVKAEFERIKKLFPKFKIGLVYGSMKGEEKDQVMNRFANNQIQILVATTVIEIGIDVPNATVILIEGAENFGLAQLHQLRGRVGRGTNQSFCYLFTTQDSQLETKRLRIFEVTTDGFALAEYDLKERGFGDLFGKQQSGFAFRFPEFITIEALKKAHQVADSILKNNPTLKGLDKLKLASNKYLEEIHNE